MGVSTRRIDKGQRFGRWVALESAVSSEFGRCSMRCDCGVERAVRIKALLRARHPSRSCGCAAPEAVSRALHKMHANRKGRITGLSSTLFTDDLEDGL